MKAFRINVTLPSGKITPTVIYASTPAAALELAQLMFGNRFSGIPQETTV